MIDFEKYYTFPASEVSCVSVGTDVDRDNPCWLRVDLKNGKALTVYYRTGEARDNAKRILCNRIAHELNAADEQILNKLYLIFNTVRRMDKRQLRIWQHLKQLLPSLGNLEDGNNGA